LKGTELVSTGKNMIYVEKVDSPAIFGSSLAHAEINAIVKLKRKEHPNIRSYTLYTTTEPCILCFGAIVMGNIRHFKFAARDRYAGAVGYNEHSGYVRSKNITIEGPYEKLEAVQVTLASYYELNKNLPNHEHLLSQMALDCPQGVNAGRELFRESILHRLVEENGSAVDAFREICNQLKIANN
jgi:tRNA(adenine34) deaminase